MSRFSNVILMNYPRTQAVIYGLGASCGFALLGTALTNVNAEEVPTMTPAWKNATKQYLKHQNCNPIWGISSK